MSALIRAAERWGFAGAIEGDDHGDLFDTEPVEGEDFDPDAPETVHVQRFGSPGYDLPVGRAGSSISAGSEVKVTLNGTVVPGVWNPLFPTPEKPA